MNSMKRHALGCAALAGAWLSALVACSRPASPPLDATDDGCAGDCGTDYPDTSSVDAGDIGESGLGDANLDSDDVDLEPFSCDNLPVLTLGPQAESLLPGPWVTVPMVEPQSPAIAMDCELAEGCPQLLRRRELAGGLPEPFGVDGLALSADGSVVVSLSTLLVIEQDGDSARTLRARGRVRTLQLPQGGFVASMPLGRPGGPDPERDACVSAVFGIDNSLGVRWVSTAYSSSRPVFHDALGVVFRVNRGPTGSAPGFQDILAVDPLTGAVNGRWPWEARGVGGTDVASFTLPGGLLVAADTVTTLLASGGPAQDFDFAGWQQGIDHGYVAGGGLVGLNDEEALLVTSAGFCWIPRRDPQSGRCRAWAAERSGSVFTLGRGASIHYDGSVYVSAGSVLYRYEGMGATTDERVSATSVGYALHSPTIAKDGTIIHATADRVYAFSPGPELRPLWTINLPASARESMAMLLDDGSLVIALDTGEIQWWQTVHGGLATTRAPRYGVDNRMSFGEPPGPFAGVAEAPQRWRRRDEDTTP